MNVWRILGAASVCLVLLLAQVTAVAGDETALTASSPEEQAMLDRTLAEGPGTYGTSDSIILQIPSAAFTPFGSGTNYFVHTDGYVRLSDGSSAQAFAPVNLPNGAQIRWLDMWYYDTSFLGDAQAALYKNCGVTPTHTLLATVDSSGSDSGYSYKSLFLSGLPTVTNACQYIVYATGLSQDSALQFRKIKAIDIWYKLQVSPTPATATFADVPVGAFAFQHIKALVDSGITAGCGGGNYCPDGYVTRAQMAVFLAKALGLHWPG
jgi:hypothetical protein